jgi:antitoxin MazE
MEKSFRSVELKVVAIGNSRGVRLPKHLLAKYAIEDAVVAEERDEGVLLRSKRDRRLSWKDTYKEMAEEREDWRDFEAAVADGLEPNDTW